MLWFPRDLPKLLGFLLNQGSTFTQHHHTQGMPRLSPALSASICLALLGMSCGSESDLTTSHQNPKLKPPPPPRPPRLNPGSPPNPGSLRSALPSAGCRSQPPGAHDLESFRDSGSMLMQGLHTNFSDSYMRGPLLLGLGRL